MTLAELRALCERATKGPWVNAGRGDLRGPHKDGSDQTVAFCTHDHDLNFIAAARTWLPALIEALAACDHLVCPTDHHTLGCLCSCAECHRRQAARARLHEVGR